MKNIDYLQVGQKVKKIRKQHRLTQEKLAELCGISTSYMGYIERGDRSLSLETACKLADVLRVSLDDLIFNGLPTGSGQLFSSVEIILQRHDKQQQERFIRIVKLLAENIEQM